MVAEVSANGQVITTIEGNVNGCVFRMNRSLHDIDYFGSIDAWL
jgi:hypothetical protein